MKGILKAQNSSIHYVNSVIFQFQTCFFNQQSWTRRRCLSFREPTSMREMKTLQNSLTKDVSWIMKHPCSRMMLKFINKIRFKYMKNVTGSEIPEAKAMSKMRPKITISESDDQYRMVSVTPQKTFDWTFKLEEEVELEGPTGLKKVRYCKSFDEKPTDQTNTCTLKEKMESFWPKKSSHWWNWNSTRDSE